MSEPRWTPGPWRLRDKGNIGNAIEAQTGKRTHDLDDGYRILATYNDAIDSEFYEDQEANRRANGLLIAAAPELYEALSELIEDIETDGGVDTSCWPLLEAGKAALARARGEP